MFERSEVVRRVRDLGRGGGGVREIRMRWQRGLLGVIDINLAG